MSWPNFSRTIFSFDTKKEFDKARKIVKNTLDNYDMNYYDDTGYSDKIISVDNAAQFRIYELFLENKIKFKRETNE